MVSLPIHSPTGVMADMALGFPGNIDSLNKDAQEAKDLRGAQENSGGKRATSSTKTKNTDTWQRGSEKDCHSVCAHSSGPRKLHREVQTQEDHASSALTQQREKGTLMSKAQRTTPAPATAPTPDTALALSKWRSFRLCAVLCR